MAAFSMTATTPSPIAKGSMQKPVSTLSGWTASPGSQIDVVSNCSYPFSNGSQLLIPSSASFVSTSSQVTASCPTKVYYAPSEPNAYAIKQIVVTYTATDHYYPGAALATATVTVRGQETFTFTKTILTDAGVCKIKYGINSTSLTNGDTNPLFLTLAGDTSAVGGTFTAPSKYISGSTSADLAELMIPALNERITWASEVTSGFGLRYMSYDWDNVFSKISVASDVATASSACVLADIDRSPACWKWQPRSGVMSRRAGSAVDGCDTCVAENKPHGVTDTLDWRGTIAVGASVAEGEMFTCYVSTSDTVKCVGTNTDGQLGDGTVVSSTIPVDVACGQATGLDCASGKLSRIVKVVADKRTACALSRGGVPYCWGYQVPDMVYGGPAYDVSSVGVPASTHSPTRFRNAAGVAFVGAVDIGFIVAASTSTQSATTSPYAVGLNGAGIGRGDTDIINNKTLTGADYNSIFRAPYVDGLDDSIFAQSWSARGYSTIWLAKTVEGSNNYVQWYLSGASARGNSSDARNSACHRVTMKAKP